MKLSRWLTRLSGLCMVSGALALAGAASVEAAKEPKNLKVLSKDLGKNVGKGMKLFSKGLGVKCEACHVKGHFDEDKKDDKLDARKFLAATVGNPDKAQREAALDKLLAAIHLQKAADPSKVWEAIDMWKKQ